jgi:GntR family transcriptional regulator, transcriptional repressor for pyruvate dehydrogenase complex
LRPERSTSAEETVLAQADPVRLSRRREQSADLVFTRPSARGESTVAEIARQLLSQLLSGQVRPGTRLPSERAMAEALGVGRSTIREALKSLDVLGILEVRTGDGTYLRQGTSDLLPQAIEWGLMLGQPRTLDLVEARRHIEIITARLAAERADEDDVATLRRHFDAMRSAPDPESLVEADIAFHIALADIARNTVLADILLSVRALLRVWIGRAVQQAHGIEDPVAEHAGVMEAVANHDPAAAAQAMEQHMSRAANRLTGSLHDDNDDQRGAADPSPSPDLIRPRQG